MKEIIIRLGAGTLRDGFRTVNVELKAGTTQWEDRSNLPPNPELNQLLNQWQLLYPAAIRLLSRDDAQASVNLSTKEGTFNDDTVANVSSQDMVELNYNLQESINNWLNFGDFGRIGRRLREDLHLTDRILVIIVSEQLKVWQLPWHFWDLFSAYPQATEAFSKPRFTNVKHIKPQCHGRVNILALSGRDPQANIDLNFLKTLPQCNPRIEKEATSALEIAQVLTKFKPAIFTFYGHGDTIQYESFQEGVIYLDNDTPLEISILKRELQKAIDLGLKIAIFNCCNGLGLAEQLADLNIPYIIVMREVIPNQTAQVFLENLLEIYSKGESFPAAFNHARQQLQLAPGGFAQFANWLPILFHNPLSDSVTWQDLSATAFSRIIPAPIVAACTYWSQPKRRIWTTVGLGLLVASLALILQSQPQIFALENQIVDRIQLAQIEKTPLSPSQVTIVNYDLLRVSDNLFDDNALQQSIKQIETIAKPIVWAIDLNLEADSAIFTDRIIRGCADLDWHKSSSEDRLQLDRCDLGLIKTLQKFGLNSLSQQNPRLNINLLTGANRKIARVNLSELIEGTKSEAQIKQLFEGKFAIVGAFDSDNPEIKSADEAEKANRSNSAVRQSIAIDEIIRANDKQNSLRMFVIRSIGEQFLWVFAWSILIGILLWYRQWKLFIIAAIVSEITIASILFIFGQGLPIIVTPIAMLLVGAILQAIRSISCQNINRQLV